MNQPVRIIDRPERARLRAEDFELLDSNGAFAAYGKAELIDGDIYVMSPQFARHGLAKVELVGELFIALKARGGDLKVFSEVSVRVAEDSMPEPDLLLAPRQTFGPVPVEAVALAVEVSDTTRDVDLGRKAQLYAASGIPEYWVIDLVDGHVVIHVRPDSQGYQERIEVPFGDILRSVTIGGLEVPTGGLAG